MSSEDEVQPYGYPPPGVEREQTGLVEKYIVYYNEPCKLESCHGHRGEPVPGEVFVLRPETDPIAREALKRYATETASAGNHKLAEDIRDWLDRLDLQQARDEREVDE